MARFHFSKTIPLPESNSRTPSKSPVKSIPEGYTEKYPFSKLQVLESVFIPGVTPYELRNSTYKARQVLGFNLVARREETRNGTLGTRVGRLS